MKLLSLVFLVIFLTSSVLALDEGELERSPEANFDEQDKIENEKINVNEEDKKEDNESEAIESVTDKIGENDWECVEKGPKRDEDTQGTEDKATHYLNEENIKELTKKEKYNSDDINCVIDRIIGDKYERYPMICTHRKSNRTVRFFDHPFVINNRFSKTSAIKSYSGSHMMLCELYKPEGFSHTNETEWTWYRKVGHRQWDEINEITIDTDVYEIEKTFNMTKLKIKSLTGDDEGEYKCMASNSWGDHEHVFDLRVMSFVKLVVPFAVTFCLMIILSVAIHVRENIIEKKELLKLMNQELVMS